MDVGGNLSVGGQIVAGSGEQAITNAAGLIDGAKIQSGTITDTQLGNGTVTATNLATESVTSGKIAAGAVGTAEVADNSLTASDLAANSVGSDEIAANAVGTSEVADNSLTSSDLGTDSVGSDEIAAGAVGASEVIDNSLTANDLAADSVGSSEIASGAVGTSEVADNSLTSADLADNSVTATEIASNAVTSAKIADDAVLPAKLNATQTYEVGRLGVGTPTVPAAGIGTGILSLYGADSNVYGPHFQATTSSDNYPLFNIMSWCHDTIALRFDAWYDGSEHKSSDAGSNASLVKYNDAFWLKYSSGNAQNSSFAWDTALCVNLIDGGVLLPHVYSQSVASPYRDLYIDNTGKLGYISSSIEFKENVRDTAEQDTAWIFDLRPVMFDYKNPAQGLNQCGLIAEEAVAVQPDIVSYKREISYGPPKTDENGNVDPSGDRPMIITTTNQPETVNYTKLTVPMLAEMKKLRNRVAELESQLAKYQALEARIAALETKE